MPTIAPTTGGMFRPGQVSMTPGSTPYLGSEAIRATGTGPFDTAYRQNLATYGAGTWKRPGGSLAFNPTDPSSFQTNPTGFGNAPVMGAPDSLISSALAGMPFLFNQSQNDQSNQSVTPSANVTAPDNAFGNWWDNFSQQGSLLRSNQ